MLAIDGRFIEPQLSGIGRYTCNLLTGLDAIGLPWPILLYVRPDTALPQSIEQSTHIRPVTVTGDPKHPLQQWSLAKSLQQHRIQLFHSPDCFAPLPVRCRRVITLHDVIPIACPEFAAAGKKGRFPILWRSWIKLQCFLARKIITVSQHAADDIHRHLHVPINKLQVIHNGIAPLQSNMTEPQIHQTVRDLGVTEPYLLYVGRQDPYKNLQRLIEAFGLLTDMTPLPIQLVIAGREDPRFPQTRQTLNQSNVADRIHITGHLTDRQLFALYHRAKVFVFPSLYEGFGLPPIEAMQHKTPVVAANRASLPEVLGDAAVYCDPLHPPAIADAVARCLNQPDLEQTLIRRGLDRARHYTITRQAEAHLKLYRQLLNDVT